MDTIAFVIKKYLNKTETFIYEPLCHIKDFEVIVLTEKKKNLEEFPYPKVFSITDLPSWQRKMENLTNPFGRFKYFKSIIKKWGIKLLHAHFGWEPKIPLGERLEKTIEFYKANRTHCW